jgi:hypothetical protein
MHPFCPLDFSALKTVSVGTNTEILQSDKFAPARQTIENLELVASVCLCLSFLQMTPPTLHDRI